MRFTVDDMDIQSLSSFLFPSYAKFYTGDFSARGEVLFGKAIGLRGHSHFRNAAVYGLPIQDVHSDLQITLSQQGALRELLVHKLHGTAIGGRFDGEGRIRGGFKYSLQAHGSVAGGKLDQLSRALGFQQIVGTGNFDASTSLTSRDFFDLASLRGPMQFEFNSGDVKSVPVVSTLGRLFPVIGLTSTNIESGQMVGQIGQGELHVPMLLLNSDAFYLLANGSASLRSGNLDFSGVLNTGGSLNDQVTQAATQRLIAVEFPALLLLTQINDLVRNRTIFFDVAGTSKHPSVQPKAAQTIVRGMLQNARRELIFAPPTAVLATPDKN